MTGREEGSRMEYQPREIRLRDGRAAVLRGVREEDAEALLACLTDVCGETPYLTRYPDECGAITLEGERAFLRAQRESPRELMLACEVAGQVAGSCSLSFGAVRKTAHRGTVGICLRKAYWGLGIGTAMMHALIDVGRARGAYQLELECLEGNARARALYEKAGFRLTAVLPDAIRMDDGALLNVHVMTLRL